jgi:hypothetical protein
VLVYVSRNVLLFTDSQGTVQHVAQNDSALLAASFLRALQFPLPILIPSTALHSEKSFYFRHVISLSPASLNN